MNICANPNTGFCLNKTIGGIGLMYKNVRKNYLFPTSIWRRNRRR